MKKFLVLITLLAMSAKMFAQDCSQYVFMKKGRTIENTTYNARGEVMHKAEMLVESITTANGATTATVSVENFGRNGASRGKNTITYKCEHGSLIIDINSLMGNQNIMQFNAANIKYPPGMKVGDHFQNEPMSFQMTMGGKTMKGNALVSDRMVAGQESITTPAGTWNCLKITYKVTTTIEGMNTDQGAQEATEWYAPNFGVVQSQFGAMVIKMTAIKD